MSPSRRHTQNPRALPLRIAAMLIALLIVICALACAAPVSLEATASPAATASPTPTPTPTPTQAPTPTPEPTPDPAMQPVTYAWISDTQGYCAKYPQTFIDMVRWIVESRADWNTQYVIHTGDVVNDMLRDREWKTATEALTQLNGHLPLFMIAGNHDIRGMVHDYSAYGKLLDKLDYKRYPSFGEELHSGRRRYDLVTIGYDEFILIGVGYSATSSDIAWLNETLEKYAERTAILIAHWYLNLKDYEERMADAQTLYQVVKRNPNVRYVLCGHRHGVRSVIQSFDDDGNGTNDRDVYAIMADYQGFPEGGGGYIALMTFDPAERVIRMNAYSPVLDDYNYFEDETRETYAIPLTTAQD